MTLPADFITQIRHLLGREECEEMIHSLHQPSPVTIRLNPLKKKLTDLPTRNNQMENIPWCAEGYYLPQRLTFTFDPLFHAGVYYVQEASSMFLEQAVKQTVKHPVLALDLCAAPGGKSTHLRSLLPEGSLLVANEVIRNRSQILAENLTKWGHPDVMVTHNDPADFADTKVLFDLILADVPCSGEGMFRKDEGAVAEWSPANVAICYQRQRRIIADIWPSLKPGGTLIYSTCTFNTKENEENIQWITDELGASTIKLDIPDTWNIAGDLTGQHLDVYRFLAHRVKGEGFFMAVLQKDSDDSFSSPSRRKEFSSKKGKKSFSTDLIKHSSYYQSEQEAIISKLKVLQSGVTIGVQKGKDTIPSQALAMTDIAERNAYPRVDITYNQAIAFLRRESLTLNKNAPRGYNLLTYRGVPLGFVKNIGNRANNLYPVEWRIRSGYLPDNISVM